MEVLYVTSVLQLYLAFKIFILVHGMALKRKLVVVAPNH